MKLGPMKTKYLFQRPKATTSRLSLPRGITTITPRLCKLHHSSNNNNLGNKNVMRNRIRNKNKRVEVVIPTTMMIWMII